MTSSAVVLGVSVAYLVLSLVVGMWPGRRSTDSAEGFVAGDRSLGLVVMYFITGATIFSSFAFLGAPGFAYGKGGGVFYILGYGALGFLPFYFLGPRAARVGRHYGFVTQAEMVAARFDSRALAVVMAVVSVVAFIPYLALQMQGAGLVLETVTRGELPMWAGAVIVYAVVTIYVLKSGVLGVGWTNTLQGIFMLVLAWGLGIYLPTKLYGGVQPMFERLAVEAPGHVLAPGTTWTWGQYSAAVVVSIIGFSNWPHLFMKAFSAKDERTLRRTVVLYPTFQIFLVPLFLIGFAGVMFATKPATPDQVLPHMLMNMQLPSVLVGLFCAGALAASMSSGDAMVHAAASIAVRDGYVRAGRHQLSHHDERALIRKVVVVTMVLAYVVAIIAHHYRVSLVMLLLSTYGAVVQFAPAVLATLYLKRVRGVALLTGMIAGSVLTVVLVIWPALMPVALHAGLYGLALNVIVIVALSYNAPIERPDETEEFLRIAAGEDG